MNTEGFLPRTVDKVERLLDLMEEMGRHPDLKGRLAMHAKAPRLPLNMAYCL